jgi:hypothetical protein
LNIIDAVASLDLIEAPEGRTLGLEVGQLDGEEEGQPKEAKEADSTLW